MTLIKLLFSLKLNVDIQGRGTEPTVQTCHPTRERNIPFYQHMSLALNQLESTFACALRDLARRTYLFDRLVYHLITIFIRFFTQRGL